MTIKVKQGEDLSKENITKVIGLLEADEPITKKVACEILKISYNTTRLNKIIEAHKQQEIYSAKRRKEIRNTPVTLREKRDIISSYLSGESLSTISDRTFRSTQVIKNILNNYNVPLRISGANYNNPLFFEEAACEESYNRGDLVYSARYNRPCYIEKFVQNHIEHGNVYLIRFTGEDSFYANQPAYELASLKKLQKEFDIELSEMSGAEIKTLIVEALLKAKKMDKK